jgi:endoglycosylceramidase
VGARGALAALAIAIASASGAEAAPTTPLGHHGRWITDATGRVVILHGVNMVYKRPPYHAAAAGFGPDDAQFLADNGFNTVRLGLIYKAVEPAPGAYDESYLDQIAATEAVLADNGIFSQLDFHQDLYNERYGGEGWPDWATIDNGLPAQPLTGFPGSYVSSPGLNRAFDNFWNNVAGPGGVGLQDRYAAAFRRVAERFASRQHTIGYDLLNEPWPGLPSWPTCASTIGCPIFDTTLLAPFHQRVIARIREVEPQKLIWYEPNVIFNFGADSNHPATGDGRTGFSFHVYCLAGAFNIPGLPQLGCDQLDELVLSNADKQAQETGDALLLSEFGATDDLSVIRRNIEGAERHMISWQYWHYCACDDPTTSGPGVQAVVIDANQPPTGANVKEEKLDLLARAFPQVVAGTPESYDFDEASRRFELALSTTGPGGQRFVPAGISEGAAKKGGKKKNKKKKKKKKKKGRAAAGEPLSTVVPAGTPQTEVFLPDRHYPKGYEADVDGGGIASNPSARVLRVAACPGRKRVSLTVRRPGVGVTDGPDCLVEGARRTRLRLRVRPRTASVAVRSCVVATVRTRERTLVEGAKVRIGSETDRTNRKGKAKLCRRFASPGRYKVTARKLGFKRAKRKITVRG